MADSEPVQKSNQELQQQVVELEEELDTQQKKPSLVWAIVIGVLIFILLLPFPIEAFFITPKFKTIFADMLGPGAGLPEFTEIVFKTSDIFKNNALITIPAYLLFSLACAGFVGFQRYFLPRPVWITITVLAFLFCLGFSICPVIAMFLPLIKMMDKLGQ